jgi:uncharacterized Zn-finger protein
MCGSGEKPHKCTDCGRCFNNKSNLMSHIQLVHKKLSPYMCDMCHETFKRKKMLLEHIGKVGVKLKLFCSKLLGFEVYWRKKLHKLSLLVLQ